MVSLGDIFYLKSDCVMLKMSLATGCTATDIQTQTESVWIHRNNKDRKHVFRMFYCSFFVAVFISL